MSIISVFVVEYEYPRNRQRCLWQEEKEMVYKAVGTAIVNLILVYVFFFVSPAEACNVPVFRYGLERWPSDTYTVMVFHRGALSSSDRELVNWLERTSMEAIPYSNFSVRTVDVYAALNEPEKSVWERLDNPELPCMAIFYPGNPQMLLPLRVERFTEANARVLVDSPVRREIARRILDGESAVWLLLESGDREKDNTASALLEAQLGEMGRTLKLPDPADFGSGEFVPIRETGPKLRIAFSMIRVSRSDPKEAMLVEMLMKSEPDLTDYTSYPMAFPVFGRGRVLFALVGKGIDKQNIMESCMFVIGPCSCQVKDQNPGVDLLMPVDWEGGLEGRLVQNLELPPLVGLSELAREATSVKKAERGNGENSGAAPIPDSTRADSISAAFGSSDEHTAVSGGEPPNGAEADTMRASLPPVSEASLGGSAGHLVRNLFIVFGFIAVVTVLLSVTVLRPHKRNFP
ncbi:hypothetical protein LLG96_14015 [bacterium]|nr:hypothetical protein [bacterium]